jgi:hypothetical protein
VRSGDGPRIAAALAEADPRTPAAELSALQALLRPPPARAGATEILPGVALEERLSGRTLTLRLKGRGVTPELAGAIRRLIAGLAPPA